MELIKTEMTPKERAKAYAAGERVDRIPCNITAAETGPLAFGIPICDYYHSADLMVEVEKKLAEATGADNMGMGLGLRGVAEAIGTEMNYKKDDVSSVKTPVFKEPEDATSRDLIDIHKDGRLPIMLEAFKTLREEYGEAYNISTGGAGPLTIAGNTLGTTKLLKSMRKNPEGTKALLQYCTDVVIKVAHDLFFECGVTMSLAEPLASHNLLSIKDFDEFCFPYVEQCVKEIKKWQSSVTLHICGSTKDRWDRFLKLGIGGFWADNCESLGEVKEVCGDKLMLIGNIPPVDVVLMGSKDDIETSVKNILHEAADSPCGFCLCPGCTTPVGTSIENMQTITNAACKFGAGAKKGCLPEGLVA